MWVHTGKYWGTKAAYNEGVLEQGLCLHGLETKSNHNLDGLASLCWIRDVLWPEHPRYWDPIPKHISIRPRPWPIVNIQWCD